MTAGSAERAGTASPVLSVRGLEVSYGSNRVLRGVDLEVRSGSITALLGTNGAGKSTLIKVLGGVKRADGGSVSLVAAGDSDPREVRFARPIDASTAGIAIVHQRIADGIVPALSVAENALLDQFDSPGSSSRPFAWTADTVRRARQVLDTLGIDWPDSMLRARVDELGLSDAQLLILARSLRLSPRVLILDEPTSALSAAEVERLFAVLRRLTDAGLAIVYVSHRFAEIETLADDVVVLRDGVVSYSAARSTGAGPAFDWDAVLPAMLGADGVREVEGRASRLPRDLALSVSGLGLLPHSAPVDLDVHTGQVLGVLGLIGAGKTELLESLAGARRIPADAVLRRREEPWRPRSVGEAISGGVALVPEDRQRQSLIRHWTISGTSSLPFLDAVASRWGRLLHGRDRARGQRVIDALGVVAPGPAAPVDDLSGGNQQKVVVGRWLIERPDVLLLDEPFRGVDVGARLDIGHRLGELAEAGHAVVVASSDIDEITGLADRIVVLVHGEVALDAAADEVDRERLVAAFLGAGIRPSSSPTSSSSDAGDHRTDPGPRTEGTRA